MRTCQSLASLFDDLVKLLVIPGKGENREKWIDFPKFHKIIEEILVFSK